MHPLIFALPGNEALAASLSSHIAAEVGVAEFRHFPDGESFVRIGSAVSGRKVILVCTLDQPDPKLLPLYFMAETLRSLGAAHITLVAPYLAYMRQDKRFHPGEAVTSDYFAQYISSFVDALVTIDPHLHRHTNMQEIYSIPCTVLHAAQPIAAWIQAQVHQPVLIGPDSESAQWVSEVAALANAPFTVLEKTRLGDREVQVSIPQIDAYRTTHTPVLIDDIISTARTMIETLSHLHAAQMQPAVCIGVHAVFAGDAFAQLQAAAPAKIVTCNAIVHPSNAISLDALLATTLL
jgi:ribose-phosphate pyrophosphokinase